MLRRSRRSCGRRDGEHDLSPYLLKGAATGYRMGNQIFDSILADGLNCPITLVHMGVTAENIAAKYGVSRHEQDGSPPTARQVLRRAARAEFKPRSPVEIKRGKGTIVFKVDEHRAIPKNQISLWTQAGLQRKAAR